MSSLSAKVDFLKHGAIIVGVTQAALVLLIIVSSALTLFLMVAIIALLKFFQVIKTLKHIADQAEKVVDTAEEAAEMFKKTAGPVALTRFIANITHAAFNKKKGD